jgi:hypothetical protein
MKKSLPAVLTSYDLIKAFALIIMLVDHTGLYFFSDDLWWRAVGRVGFPVWFFLVGYSSARDISRPLWIGAIIVTLAWAISGRQFFPLNALVTIMLIRLSLDWIMARALRTRTTFWGMFLCLSLASLPSNLPFEYGTLAFLFAMLGYMRRHKQQINFSGSDWFLLVVGVVFVFIINQLIFMPEWSADQFAVMTLGTLAVAVVLFVFQPREYPVLGRSLWVLAPLIQFLGRRTLEIYIIHIVVYAAMSMVLYPEKYQFMNFVWVPYGMVQVFTL